MTFVANTPDGDTFVYALPTVKLVKFPKECAVHTEWDDQRLPPLMPVYALRGRTAVAQVLRGTADIDRGVIPYYFFQQVVGRRDIQSCPMRQAGGLGSAATARTRPGPRIARPPTRCSGCRRSTR